MPNHERSHRDRYGRGLDARCTCGNDARLMAGGASWLLLEEHFKSEDARFLDELFAADAEKKLKALADRWSKDQRPFAREILLRYIDDGCDRPHHRPLVKKLYKNAEEKGDDEVLARFMVAFDRLLHRELVKVDFYDWQSRTTSTRHELRAGADVPRSLSNANRESRFSVKTRIYLARRVSRYFRNLGKKDKERYYRAMKGAIVLYEDDALAKPEQLLDAWSLLHVLYHGSAVIVRSPRGARLAHGRALRELTPKPLFPEVWNRPDDLLAIVEEARSRTVRGFALALLRENHAQVLRTLPLARLLKWLKSSKEDLQLVAVDQLEHSPALLTLPIGDWLSLLEIDNLLVLPKITALFEKNVAPTRLDLGQCVRLACAQTGPVAELGLRWLRERTIGAHEIRAVLPLAEAKAPVVREDAVKWLVSEIQKRPESRPEDLREVIDSKFADARAVALPVVEAEPRFEKSPILWSALAESPHDEVRMYLVQHLEARLDRLVPSSIEHVWATALLAVHRGGRAKQRVIKQVSDELIKEPNRAESLAPILRVALRSVRVPERRSALAAVARAAFEKPELRTALAQHFPELSLPSEDAVCR
jgi:hypothetical protein